MRVLSRQYTIPPTRMHSHLQLAIKHIMFGSGGDLKELGGGTARQCQWERQTLPGTTGSPLCTLVPFVELDDTAGQVC